MGKDPSFDAQGVETSLAKILLIFNMENYTFSLTKSHQLYNGKCF